MVMPGPVRWTVNTDAHQLLVEMNTLRRSFAVLVTRLPPFRGSLWFSTLGSMERRELRIQPSYYFRPGRGPQLPHWLSGSRLGSPLTGQQQALPCSAVKTVWGAWTWTFSDRTNTPCIPLGDISGEPGILPAEPKLMKPPSSWSHRGARDFAS